VQQRRRHALPRHTPEETPPALEPIMQNSQAHNEPLREGYRQAETPPPAPARQKEQKPPLPAFTGAMLLRMYARVPSAFHRGDMQVHAQRRSRHKSASSRQHSTRRVWVWRRRRGVPRKEGARLPVRRHPAAVQS